MATEAARGELSGGLIYIPHPPYFATSAHAIAIAMQSNVNARNRATSAAHKTIAIIAAACTPRSGRSSHREEGDDEDRTRAHQPQLSPTRTMMNESTAATRAMTMTLKTVAAFMVCPLVSKMVATAKLFKLHCRPSLAGGCLRRLGKLSVTLRRLRSASATAATITPACREISHVAQ